MKKELAFFEEVSRTLMSSLELSAVLRTIMKKTKNLIRAETCSILLVDEETGDLVFEKTITKKERGKRIGKERLKLGEGIAGWVAQEQVPVIVPDVSTDPRFNPRVGMESDFRAKSIMCVPIKNKGNILGVLEIVNKINHEPFTKSFPNGLRCQSAGVAGGGSLLQDTFGGDGVEASSKARRLLSLGRWIEDDARAHSRNIPE